MPVSLLRHSIMQPRLCNHFTTTHALGTTPARGWKQQAQSSSMRTRARASNNISMSDVTDQATNRNATRLVGNPVFFFSTFFVRFREISSFLFLSFFFPPKKRKMPKMPCSTVSVLVSYDMTDDERPRARHHTRSLNLADTGRSVDSARPGAPLQPTGRRGHRSSIRRRRHQQETMTTVPSESSPRAYRMYR